MSEALRTGILLTVVFVSACNGAADEGADEAATSETGESESGAETETDTGDPIAGCECIIDEVFTQQVMTPKSPTCGADLCPKIEVGDQDVVANPEAVDCALTALRDRTPGIVTWHYSINIGQTSDTGYILIAEDGRAVQRSWGADDKSYTISDANLGELEAADVFDACLAEPEAIMRYYCVRSGMASVAAVCDEGLTF